MPQNDYAQAERQQVWVTDEGTFNVLAQPVVTDQVTPVPGASFPPILSTYVPSQERRATPGVAQLIKRKKPPGQWSLPFYLKAQAVAGDVPSFGLLLKKLMGTETINGGTSVVYTLASAIEETSCTIMHRTDNFVELQRGCKPTKATIRVSGEDEGRLIIEGWANNAVMAGTTTLNGGIDNAVTSVVVTDSRVFQVGPAGTDTVRILIDTEVLLITAIDYATHTLTVTRAQAGSAAAAHSNGAEVSPWSPGADTDPADIIIPLTDGSVTIAGDTYLVTAFEAIIDTKLTPRLDQYAQSVSTGFRRSARYTVSGSFTLYQRKADMRLMTAYERALEMSTSIVAGTAPTQRVTLTIPKLRFLEPTTIDETEGEFLRTFPWFALESATPGLDAITLTFD